MKFIKILIIGFVIVLNSNAYSKELSYTLEDQIEILNEFGISLNENVTIDDLLYSFDREAYESKPFDLILHVYGIDIEREPWGRKISNSAWNFDVECIEDNGSYINIVKNVARISDNEENLTNIQDSVNFETEEAWVSYSINGKEKHYNAKFDNDWADPTTVLSIMSDLTENGFSFYAKDNGQASIWFYLDDKTAKKLNKYSNNSLVN